jgi:hypothetical protein
MHETSAICGLFCESCGIFIATAERNEAELERLAAMMKTTKEEIRCLGCRSAVLSPHCRDCEFKKCASLYNATNCEDCESYPCDRLSAFQKQMPHRAELFESARYRKANGLEKWVLKMKKDYSCESCGYLNSPYYVTCKKCGNYPANDFVRHNASLFRKQEG